MSSTSSPSYNEIYESVLDKVERKIAESKNLSDRESFAIDIMDALAEAYRIGQNKGMQYVAELITTAHPPQFPPTNPYERTPSA
jgi:hypothetical protein